MWLFIYAVIEVDYIKAVSMQSESIIEEKYMFMILYKYRIFRNIFF